LALQNLNFGTVVVWQAFLRERENNKNGNENILSLPLFSLFSDFFQPSLSPASWRFFSALPQAYTCAARRSRLEEKSHRTAVVISSRRREKSAAVAQVFISHRHAPLFFLGRSSVSMPYPMAAAR
jgi:hypothetical protein